MKAWIVTDQYREMGSEIAFAETRGKAKAIYYRSEPFEDYEWNELRAIRFKDYDQYYDGKAKVDFWYDEEHRIRLVRDFGWFCHEQYEKYCEECPAKQWCLYWEDEVEA